MNRRGLSYLILLTGAVLLLVGCASGTAPGGERRYGLEVADAVDAVQRGEAREALAYYEREAADLERRGQGREAAKAYSAVALVSSRLGAYQKAIHSGLQALELLKPEPKTEGAVSIQVSVYSTIAHGYRRAGDLEEARRYFEQGLDLTKSFPRLRRSLTWSGNLLRGLASVAYAQGDYPGALKHGMEAVDPQTAHPYYWASFILIGAR